MSGLLKSLGKAVMVKSTDSGIRETQVQILVVPVTYWMIHRKPSNLSEPQPHPPFSCCVILAKFPNLSEVQGLHLKNEVMPVRCLGHSPHVINVSDSPHLSTAEHSVPLGMNFQPRRSGSSLGSSPKP